MMREFVREYLHQPYRAGWLAVLVLVLLLVMAAGCTPVNAPDPATTKQKFRADLAMFCLRNPEAIGCEKFSKGVRR
ncbi:MAG: hypothetical protein P1U37_18790 [Minwuia sp.]|nr:hypothetical protein [Minwuia sp.]